MRVVTPLAVLPVRETARSGVESSVPGSRLRWTMSLARSRASKGLFSSHLTDPVRVTFLAIGEPARHRSLHVTYFKATFFHESCIACYATWRAVTTKRHRADGERHAPGCAGTPEIPVPAPLTVPAGQVMFGDSGDTWDTF